MRYEDTSGSISSSATVAANNDADTLPNGSNGPATGNVITGAGTTTGKAGADTPASGHVVEVRGASGTDTTADGGNMNVDGRFGTLAIDDNGNYKYVAEGHAPANFRDIFQYTLADQKGGRATADLVISRGGEIKVADNAQRIVPGPDGVVTLPDGVNLNNIQVLGRDLIVTLPDGSQIIIVDGAVFVPQLVLGGVEVPATNLAALMIESEAVRTVAGPPQSSGGNFDVPVPPLDPGVPLGDLIPPTELVFNPPTFEEVGQVLDREPEAGAVAAQLDDDAKSGGNAGGTGDDPDSVNATGFLPGEGGDGSLAFDLLNSGAPSGFTYIDGPNGSILVQQVQDGNTVTVLTITIDAATGAYAVTQNAAIRHPAGNEENNVEFIINYTVTDDDGDVATGSLTINVDDDTPTVSVTAGSDSAVLLTTHDALTIGNASEAVSTTANFSNVFGGTSSSPGADGAGAGTTSGYALSTTGGASGLFSHGVAINLYNVGGVIVGSTAASAAGITADNTIFTVSTSNTGIVTLTQFAQIDHTNSDPSPTGTPFEDHGISLADGAITLTRTLTVVDRDGDSVTGSAAVQIGANLRFLDDGPTIGIADRGEPSLTVDETDLGTNASASFAANFAANFGADGPANTGSITYALGINAGATGLVDVATGQPIVLVVNGGVVEGHVGDANGAIAFTISVDAAGTVTLDQIRALQHPDPTNTDESISFSADNLVTLTATAHDFDGDTDSATINIGQNLNFEDDAPQPFIECPDDVIAVNDPDSIPFTGDLNLPDVGADEPGVVSFGVNDGDPVLDNEGSQLSSDGQLLYYFVNDQGVLEARAGDANGDVIFTITLNGDGTFTFDQVGPITSETTLSITDLSSVGGGNVDAKAIDVPDSPFDLILTTQPGNTVNTNATEMGVGTGNSLEAGEILRVDLVQDAFVTGSGGGAVLNFGEYYTANAYRQDVSGLGGPQRADFIVRAVVVNEAGAGPADGDNVFFGDTNDSFVTGTGLNIYDDNGALVDPADYAGLGITVTGLADGWQIVGLPNDYDFEITSATAFNAVQIEAIAGTDTFKLGFIDITTTVQSSVDLTVPIVLTDADGDPVVCDIDIILGPPLNVPDVGVTVDEAAMPSGSDPSSTAETQTGDLQTVVTGGVGPYTFALVGSGDGAHGTLTLNPDGTFNYTLDTRFDSTPDANDGTNTEFGVESFTFQATDANGIVQTGTITVNIIDDVPSINLSGTEASLTVDETVLATNASASFASAFSTVPGADGAASVTYALNVLAPGANSGLVDVATGQNIVLVNNAGVIEGHVGNAAGALAFTVTVDGSGNVTLDQIRAVTHPNPANPDDSVTLSADNLVSLTATITDGDGDQDSVALNIGQNLNFEDDGPSITLSGTEGSLTVDETNLAADAGPTSFAGAFTPLFGADGAAAANSLTYALAITGGNGTNSGLVDTATDEAVLLVNNGGVIEGRTQNSNLLVFTVSVDAAGNVSLDQVRAVVHPNTANPDDSITLSADNLITLTATATDRDGDQASASLNIGQNLNFEDDGPSANNDTDVTNPQTDTAVGNVITGVGTTEGAGNADAPGADGYGAVTNLVGSTTSDNDAAGGFTAIGTHGTLQMDANGNYTYTRTGGVGGSTDTFTYTYVDGDGDPATATLIITIADENPVAGNVNVALDDDVIPAANGNLDGVGDDNPDLVGENTTGGTLPGSGGNGTLTFSIGTNVAPAGFTYDTSTPGTLLINQGATTVITITVASDGTYTVTQNAPIIHATGGDENNQPFTINYVVTDGDGDPANGTISINVDDDTPVISASSTQPQLTVDETVLATNASASFAGVFTNAFGADGPALAGSVTYALAITGGNGVNSGLIDVATGQNIVLVNNAGVIEGHVGNAAGALAFTVTVDGSGNVTLDQIRAVTHPDANNPDDSVTLAADNLVTLSSTITDRDGDTATATANIGQNLNFEDDGPSISASTTQPQLTVDETVLATNASASFASVFTSSFGADGAGTVTYALGITGGNGVASGLVDVATGQNIVLVNNAGVIEGHVGNAAGALAFTVTVDGSGNVTLDQIRAVTHPNTANPDDSVTLSADNLVTLTATVTDRDGDQASATANIGQNLNFEDDGPTISTTGAEPQLTVDETVLATNDTQSFAANFTSAFGADGAGTLAYALTITGGNGVDSGLDDVATGQNIVLVNNAGVIEGHVGNAAGALAFTVTVDGSGNVTLDQIRAVTHPNTANPDDSVTLSADNLVVLTATVTDRDGDSQSASLNIGQNLNFEDDGPTAAIVETGQGVSVDESVGIQVDSNDTTNAAIIALFAGVSNPGTDTHLPQYATNASAVVASTGSAYGADGAGTTAFSLNVSSAGVDSGLDTTDGTSILLYKEGDLIVGRVGSQAGPAAFAIAIDPVTGQISMVEYLSIQHPNAADPDDSVSIADGAVQAVVTVTDRDGDSATSTPTNIGSLISFQDSAPVMTAAQNINIQNSGDVAHTGQFAFNLGADGAATNNDVITNVTFSATVNGAAVTNPQITETIAETATSVTYGFSFNYVTGPGAPPPTAAATGTITFDKVAGTYTVDLANPIQGFTTIVQTATGTLFQGYEFGTSTVDGSQPEISVTQIQGTPGNPQPTDLFLQFTSVAEPSSGTGDNNLELTSWVPGADNPPRVDGGGDTSWSAGELFNQDDSWVSTSNSDNGVAGDTIQGGEVLDFTIVQGANPTGTLAQPAAFGQASTMFLKFDGIGSGEDFIIILKLYDTVTNTYTTKALIVENADIQKGPGTGPGLFSTISLDNNDGLIIIEPNDYQEGNTNLVIVGAQIAGSDEGVAGTGLNFNYGGVLGVASTAPQDFSADVNDGPMKISSIGLLSQTTTAQPAQLTFNVTVTDGDGDSITQTVMATISASADSASAATIPAGNTTVSAAPLGTKSTAAVSESYQPTQQTTTNSNNILMGAFAAAGLAASESLAAAPLHGDLNSSVSSLATAAYHTQNLAPIALDAAGGSHGFDAMPALNFARPNGLGEAATFHSGAEQFAAHSLAGINGEAAQPVAAAFLQGTQLAAHDAGMVPAMAPVVAMPAAAQLAAMGNGGVAGAQHNQVVSQVLADALHGGGGAPALETALNALPGHGGGDALAALASHNAMGVPISDSGALAGFTAAHSAFTMEAAMVHVDAVQPHA